MFKHRITVDNGSVQRRNSGPAASSGTVTGSKTETANLSLGVGFTGSMPQTTYFRGILPDNSGDDSQLGVMLRDIWHYDNVGGSAVDLQCGMAFSDWTLTGVSQDIAEIYSNSLARLNMRVMLPQISRNYLVDGAFIGTLLWDSVSKEFQDCLIHDRFNSTISPQPFFSVDPVVTVNSASVLQQFLNTYSPYAESTLNGYPKELLKKFMQGSNVLDPVTSLIVLRKGMQDSSCVSYLRRLLPMYALERTLFRGTLVEASKRQKATSQITVGTDSWEPNPMEMQEILNNFQNADLDPLGAWLVTRQGVNVTEVRPGGEMWKWTDTADVLVPYKLRALGISEAFLSSDASYANAEASVTMFLDNLETYRSYMTYKLFYSKLFPLIAVLNGFYKEGAVIKKDRSLSSLMYNMSNQKNLKIPKIQWHKNLQSPNSTSLMDNLEKLSSHGFPVALKTWAAASNIDLGSLIHDMEQDSAIRKTIAKINPGSVKEAIEQGTQENQEEASMFARKLDLRPGSKPEFAPKSRLLERPMHGSFKFSKTGKILPVSANEVKDENEKIYKAVMALRDPHRLASVKKNLIEKNSRMPTIGLIP